jgi:uncharacterized glyoxalase superfamily protein PhnB
VADITHVATCEGWLFLAVVIDAFSRRCVGWSMRDDLKADLVVDALGMAVTRRRPAEGVVHHSDRGSQYASLAFGATLRDSGVLASMGGRGDAYDNEAKFLDFVKEALAAEELARVYDHDGGIGHAEARIDDAIVMVFDSSADWPDTPQFLRLYVEDANATYARALAAGARPITEVTELGFGDRVGRFADPWNNIWWVQEHLEAISLEEMARRMEEPKYVEAMRYVQDTLRAEMRLRGKQSPRE